MAILDRFFTRAVRIGELTVTYADGTTKRFGAPEPKAGAVAIRFTDKGAPGAILRDPALGAAEAYMDGRLEIDQGDILDLIRLLTYNNMWEHGLGTLEPNPLAKATGAVLRRIDRINYARRARRNVAHHYDLSDRLYDLFLDADRQYSCAYFTDPANGLEQAQHDKKAHIAAKLLLEPGHRVLDIGCGWGGMAIYLAERFGAHVTGITLSEEQLKVARRRAEERGLADRVKFELIDYRAMTGRFDRIVSVGMFEHVGPPHYREFFRKCFELLTPMGVMLLHTIGRAGAPGVTDAFTAKYIFPGGYIPALSEMARGYEGLRWFMTDCETLRYHYAFTLNHWYERVVANRDAIVEMYDERFYRMWTFYLAGSHASFLNGGLVNYQLQFARSRNAVPITRDYITDWDRSLQSEWPAKSEAAA